MNRFCALGFLLLLLLFDNGNAIQCYECTSLVGFNENEYYTYDPCYYGDTRYLNYVNCREPSVCAAYHYHTEIPEALSKLSISRGCQALRFGATCEDIFNDLRERGSVLPGQHTCTTCSTDLCNTGHALTAVGLFALASVVFLLII